jgi:hypothetical protein
MMATVSAVRPLPLADGLVLGITPSAFRQLVAAGIRRHFGILAARRVAWAWKHLPVEARSTLLNFWGSAPRIELYRPRHPDELGRVTHRGRAVHLLWSIDAEFVLWEQSVVIAAHEFAHAYGFATGTFVADREAEELRAWRLVERWKFGTHRSVIEANSMDF